MRDRKRLHFSLVVILAIGIALVVLSISISMGGKYTKEGITNRISDFSWEKPEYIEETIETNNNITELDFNLAACETTIQTGDKFSVKGYGISSECLENGKVWKIRTKKNRLFNFHLFTGDRNVDITIPKDYHFDKINLTVSAGELEVDRLLADEFSLNVGAGDATIQDVQVQKTSMLKVGAGDIEIEGGKLAGETAVKCGAGEIQGRFDEVTGEFQADCGVGSIELSLPGGKDLYEFNTDATMGKVNISDDNFNDEAPNQEKLAMFDLDCSVGEIEVSFH